MAGPAAPARADLLYSWFRGRKRTPLHWFPAGHGCRRPGGWKLNTWVRRLRSAARAPLADPDWPSVVAIGGALQFIPLVGPVWPAGYLVRYARSLPAGGGSAPLPRWDGWGDLFRLGLAVWTLVAVWQFPGLLLLSLASVYLGIAAFEQGGWITTGQDLMTPGVIFLGGGLLLLAAGFALTPASFLVYVASHHLVTALRPDCVLALIRQAAAVYLKILALCALCLGILLSLSLTPPGLLVMLLAGPFVAFYLTLVWARLWIDGLRELAEKPLG